MLRIPIILFPILLAVSLSVDSGALNPHPSEDPKPFFAQEERNNGSSYPPIVFVSRKPLVDGSGRASIGALPGFGPVHRTTVVGGKLLVRESNGKVRLLVDSTKVVGGIRLVDVSDPRASLDGRRIVFAGTEHRDSSWRIYEVGRDGKGLRKLTRTDRQIDLRQFGATARRFERYDDFDPCYLPSGQIVFSSTRFPSIAETGDVLTSNLFLIEADGSNLRRITTERNGADQPTIDPATGRIVYARWWLNVDLPSNVTRDGLTRNPELMAADDVANIWHAITIMPDGDDVKLYAADVRTRIGSHGYRPAIAADGRLLSVFSPNLSLVPTPGGFGVRWFHEGPSLAHSVIGARDEDSSNGPFATDPVPLPDGRVLISYSTDGIDYGLYICRLDGSGLSKIVDYTTTLELNADILLERKRPPIIPHHLELPRSELPPTEDPSTYYINESFRFDCLNIFSNADVDVPIPDAPRIARSTSIRFFINFQRQRDHAPDPSILVRTVPVHKRGGVHEHDLPADVPMFEQILDSAGRVLIGRAGNAAHVTGLNFNRAGTGTKCVGCHAGHSLITVPKNYLDAEWTNVSPSARVSASSALLIQDSIAFLPDYVVDRKVQLSGTHENWVADSSQDEYILLTWDTPVEVKQLVLYGIPPNPHRRTNSTIEECTVTLLRKSDEVYRIRNTETIGGAGTKIQIDPPVVVDGVRINIDRFQGTVEGKALPGLAEVETIARLAL